MKIRIIPILAVCGVLASTSAMFGALEAPSQANAPINGSAPQYSGRVNEVVALTQSGVDQSIVLSFIKASPGPFQPSADEIIKLRDAGVSSQVITAMLQRGAELRDQAQAVAVAAPAQDSYAGYAQTAPAYAQTAPAPVVAAQPPAYVDPTYSYAQPAASSVVYIGGSYGYPSLGYNYGYSYPYCYPYSYCYPRVGFVYAPRIGIGFRGGFAGPRFGGGGFHVGFSGGGGGFHVGGGHR